MRHPADSEAWKSLNKTFSDFAKDVRNVRLGLSSDGFNPGANMSSRYRDDIDVFLQPLVDELNELSEFGVKTFDAYAKETFNMRVVLLWTINDFPAYANLFGWCTKGALVCSNCHLDTKSHYLKHGHKYCYKEHRRWLPIDHKWRLNRSSFGGKVQRGPPPVPLTGFDVLEQLNGYSNLEFGKASKGKRKRGERYIVHQWKKRSVFFQLPYWRHLLVRNNLDVMHVEKNVCESIFGTMLDLPGKNKDSLNARLDLVDMKMHDKLRPKSLGNDKWCVSLQTEGMGLKTHDFHVFMQDLLTPAFQGVLDENVLMPLQELSLFFKQLCSKTLKVAELEKIEMNIAITLCKLERIFIPAFFDVMIHLLIHLATEARMVGPVHYRWMYRFERAMRTFKSFVRNKAHPEASIANGYIEMECKPLGKGSLTEMTAKESREAQLYVMFNCDELKPLLTEYEHAPISQRIDLCKWFEDRITKLWKERDPRVTEELLCLARGPMKGVVTFDGYVINGFRFHTKKRQRNRKTQNSGVVVKGDEESGQKDFYGVLENCARV
ncbi:uncharacterized protein LOC130589636 [Beta vulgaris subsp. vulgaris]|uniref:uncharacterized protein LOC130589636 n=1 Tax=Beta vulgaris subsp. vulgaris TaxID=3555 RepID=UPI002547141F|nr:uncharacterized protein LOC130589636 [Beta vulgaris subsp. vulgaris]